MEKHSSNPCEDPGSIPGPRLKTEKQFTESHVDQWRKNIRLHIQQDALVWGVTDKSETKGLQKMMVDRDD